MTIFAAAVDDPFADPNIARDAVWRAGGTGAAVSVRVIMRRPDRIGSFGETRLLAETMAIDVRTAEVPVLAEGDGFELDSAMFTVQGEPVRYGERFVWTAEVVPA